jgi:hypothetical protein
MEAYEWLSRVYPWSLARTDLGHAISHDQRAPLRDNTDRCATTIGKVQLPQTYQFFRCFKCCFLRIEQAKRKARTCSICIPGVRICREQCKKRIVCGKHAANLASSKLELLDQLKSSLRAGPRFPLPASTSRVAVYW